jgi:hypothetical protein
MLSEMCERRASDSRTISVVARDLDRLNALATRPRPQGGRIVPVGVDCRDGPALRRSLDVLSADYGRPTRTICWVHEEVAPDAPLQIAGYTENTFWHILGSVQPDLSQAVLLAHWRDRFNRLYPALDYRQITLGFVISPEGASRWLSNDEISQGVEAALNTHQSSTVIGTINPWSLKP